jgi:hypothetical protein
LRQLTIAFENSGFSTDVSFQAIEGSGSPLSGRGSILGILTLLGILTASPTIIASPVHNDGNSSDKLPKLSGIAALTIPWSWLLDNLKAINVPHCDKIVSSKSDGR